MSRWVAMVALVIGSLSAQAGDAPPVVAPTPSYDAVLAESLGADAYGMRRYVLVLLKTGPTPLPPGPERDAMFRGHFANMNRLADEGILVQAGPLDGVMDRRGLFILAVADIEAAQAAVATDPVIAQGEMVAEYHRYYGSAALPLLRDLHERIAEKRF